MIQLQITDELLLEMGGSPEGHILYAMEGDTAARKIRITLLDKGESWPLPQGVSPALAFRKADRHQGLYDRLPDGTQAVTAEGSAVTVALAPQVLSFPGDVKAAVVFRDDKLNQLSSFPFMIRVLPNPAAGQSVSNDYYHYTTLAEVNEAVDAALASLEEAKQDFLAKAEQALAVVHDTATEDAPAIVCEESGAVITVADAANRPLAGLSIYGKTTQNGTPAPDAPVPLESIGEAVTVTVAGKNLFDFAKAVKQYCVFDENGRLTNTVGNQGVTKQSNYGFQEWSGRSRMINHNVILWESGKKHYTKTITLHPDTTTLCLRIFGQTEACLWIEDLPLQKGMTLTLSFDMLDDTPQAQILENIQIEAGAAATAYEPAKAIQTLALTTPGGLRGISVPSGGNYTDAEGQQWICDTVDFARGVYIRRVEYAAYDASEDESWYKHSTANDTFNFCMDIPNLYSPPTDGGTGTYSYGLCNRYLWTANRNLVDANRPGISCDYGGRHRLFVGMGTLIGEYTMEAFRAWLAEHPLEVVYQLQTEEEISLSADELAAFAALHSNQPNATVFNDGGAEMKLSYVADTKTYIDQKLAAISAAMLGN